MDILNKLKQIQALAQIGIHYSHNEFDYKRYQEINEICLSALSDMTDIDVNTLRTKILEQDGYKTPKVDIRAVVFNDSDEILMVREKIDGCWSLPGGWADIGLTPSEIAVKEALEEAGAIVKAGRLLGVLDKRMHDHPADIFYIYKIFIECELIDWTDSDHMETSAYGFFSLKNLPPLSLPRNTPDQIQKLFEFHSGRLTEPMLD
jgi:ADP-ribose pyrophosphatase YjhB (NUDIX family)